MNFLYRFYFKLRDSFAARVNYRLKYDLRSQFFTQQVIQSTKLGIQSATVASHEIVVSLTTHGRRIHDVYLAIESIMQGSVLPNRIVLWLSEAEKDYQLPKTLVNQEKRGLEIRYTQDIGPYTKLIPSLLAFPDASIVTIDDDIIYPYDTLEMLLNAHMKYPNLICANQVILARYDKNDKLALFRNWKPILDKTSISPSNFFEGFGGVLYPPRCFSQEVFNRDVFFKICPTADDIWFNFMAKLNHRLCVCANSHYPVCLPFLVNEEVQDLGLWRINNAKKNSPHERQLHAVMDYYHLKPDSI